MSTGFSLALRVLVGLAVVLSAVSAAGRAGGRDSRARQRATVMMVASRKTARAGQAVTLSGTVFAAPIGPLAGMNMPQTVTLLRRAAGSRRFVVIRRVRSRDWPSPCYCDPNENPWSTTIRPRATASYIARIVDPPETTIWERAESRRVVVRVTRPPTSQ